MCAAGLRFAGVFASANAVARRTASMKRIALATLAAFAAANAILFAFVLPAEFGVDPTGVGDALGLTGLAGAPPTNVHRTATPLVEDARRFELAPFESVELKYQLAAGDGLVYAWTANGAVNFDLHAEPDAAAPGIAESFAHGRAERDSGTYVAPFDGVHGWFWENRGAATVVVSLRSAGFATAAKRYHDGRAEPVEIGSP